MDNKGSNLNDQAENTESTQESQEQYVARKAYEEVSKDMHKYKLRAKELEASKNEYEARLKSIEEQKMMEEKRWQELYEKEKDEKSRLAQQRENDRNLYLRSVKLSALKNELGGKIKDVYLQHADIDGIEIDENGSLSSESVLKVANKFRQEFPEVIPVSENVNITGNAPPSQFSKPEESIQDKLKKMTFEEKQIFLKQLKS